MTAILATLSRMSNQIPMSWARSAIGRLTSHTNLSESIRISKMLLASAKNGASGNAATKMVMKPNWRTAKNNLTWQLWVLSSGILRLSINTPNKNEDCSRARPEGTPYSHNQLVIIIICFRTRLKKFRQFRKSENIANTGCLWGCHISAGSLAVFY